MSLNSENAGLICVTVKVPAYWHEPHLWAWSEDGRNAFYSWPGGVMTKAGNCYTLHAPDWVDHIIVNACNGYYKTDDIVVESGKEVYLNIRDRENFILSFDEMEEFPDGYVSPVPVYEEETEDKWVLPQRKESKSHNSKKLIAAGAVALGAALGAGIFIAVKKHKKIRT